jgi:hypothetical protein
MFVANDRRFRVAAILMAVSFFMAGGSNLFTGNLFSSLDGPPSAGDIRGRYADENGDVPAGSADAFVDDLEDAASTDRFFDDLNDTDRSGLRDSLESVYENEDVDEATRQSAAVLAAEVTLRGTNSGETINNVADVLTSSEGVDSFSEPSVLLDQIIPDSAKGDPDAIERILNDMVAAADAFDALGTTLTDSDGDGTIDNAPAGANMTELAQQAAVAMVVRNLVNDPNSGGAATLSESIASGTVEDTQFGDPLSSENTDGSALNNILKAGGLDGVFDTDS